MTRTLNPLILLLAAGLSVAACNKSPADAQADAVRDTSSGVAAQIDKSADAVEANGKAAADATKTAAENKADVMHDQADAVKANGEAKADAIEKTPPADTTTVTTATTKTK